MEPGAWWPSNNDEHYLQSNKKQRHYVKVTSNNDEHDICLKQ